MQVETLSNPFLLYHRSRCHQPKDPEEDAIGEEVVEEDMMVLPLQLSSQCLHNSRSKVVLGCATLRPSIYFKPREVAIVTICRPIPLCPALLA